MTDKELEEDVKEFAQKKLPVVPYEQILRAARVAKDIRMYDEIARRPGFDSRHHLPVTLTEDEKTALRRERDVTFSERGMWTVIATVSLAALLQGKSSLRCCMLRGHAPILTERFNSRFRPILLERRRVI